ncbi:YiiX/YebB-like N1pC/P60 family cysteine hydrolase [Pollutimonas thiosulfatoxidans]|uniref:Permuted papain-like amidase enzyme, YaeF/YiiX, C92 family n=1 Tax=Pollutimonas thiosulfatoxidans TaxID=2028345 RepID=A0A410GAW6_9BURK|nr:YiiX/YebB-like N1pC/P60 family cysteine hydrolase [Pollutimonas thiosulfatoxidans]QAA93434.1 hypothetical protein CKA81_05995 [Pollutimonas thiosulfatoxidans]
MQKTSPSQASQNPKFGLDLSILKVGDVLLSANHTRTSTVIARATKGHFSHAMLYVGHSFIHAMPDGVYSKNPQRYIRDEADHLAAYRIVPGQANPTMIDIACDYARGQVGALYSVPAAALSKAISKSNKNIQIQSGKQFCSRLVAQAYENAGIKLVANADFCSPNDLARSIQLDRVENAVRELNLSEVEFAESHDFNQFLQKITFQWLGKARSLALRRHLGEISTQSDILPMLVKHPGYDKAVTKYVKASGYPDYYDWDRSKNPYRYDVGVFLRHFNHRESFIEALEWELPSVMADLKRHTKNYQAAVANLQAYGDLEYVQIEFLLAKNLLNEVLQRKKTLINASQAINYPISI